MDEQNTWGVFDLSNNPVFDVDSMIDLSYDSQNRVSSFPVEKGAFTSFNKAASPFKAKVRLAVGGSDRIDAFVSTLEMVLAGTDLYNVVTPQRVYQNVSLERIAYARSKEHGVSMLSADLEFVQIRQVSPQYISVKRAGSAKKVDTGKTQAEKPRPSLRNVTISEAYAQGRRREVGGK